MSTNDVMNRVGPGTPMGNLFRRFWLPALLSKEIAGPDSAPVRLRILGEDLVAFRDTKGRVGILSAYCRHRLAPLFFGRNEDCGLRCVYHGWKWNVDGDCVDMPNIQPPDNYAELKEKARITSYPAAEAGGIVWIYMGPKEHKPKLPGFEWAGLPLDHVHVSRWFHRSNWHIGMEGEIDTSHISFLHSSQPDPSNPRLVTALAYAKDGAPEITLRETDYGYIYGSRRTYQDQYYWRVTQWMLPTWSAIPGGVDEFVGNGRCWIPVDDQHTMAFGYMYRADRPLNEMELKMIESGGAFPPRTAWRSIELPNGSFIDAPDTVANKWNNYLIDRDMQRNKNYSGIWGISEQDRALQENLPWRDPEHPGTIDTTQEMLVRSDFPIMVARRILTALSRELEKGVEPAATAKPETYGVRAISILSPIADFDELMAKHGELGKAAVRAVGSVPTGVTA